MTAVQDTSHDRGRNPQQVVSKHRKGFPYFVEKEIPDDLGKATQSERTFRELHPSQMSIEGARPTNSSNLKKNVVGRYNKIKSYPEKIKSDFPELSSCPPNSEETPINRYQTEDLQISSAQDKAGASKSNMATSSSLPSVGDNPTKMVGSPHTTLQQV